jgi:alpha-1,2-mannosyltransferase
MTIQRGRPSRRERTAGARAALVALNLGAGAYFLLKFSGHRIGLLPYRIDLDVYRIGGRVWLDGGNLYGPLPPTAAGVRLPFSYPPAAAILLSPLSLPPMAVAGTLLTLLSAGLTAVVLRVFLASAWPPAGHSVGPAGWRTAGWLLPVALVLEPVRNTINYGQVNVLLMALVAADCLVQGGRWPRGALIGLAAAVKLTPAAFVLFFLLRRDYRAARTAALSFCVAAAAGFTLAWRDSVRYWTSVVFQSGRPGNPAYAANQSVEAVLTRAGLAPHSPAGLGSWLAACTVLVLLASLGMRPALDRGLDAWALSLNAFAALLVSPVSWSHHWVWGETAMLALACLSLREQRPAWRRGGLSLAAAGTALFAFSPQWWFPSAGLRWAWWEQLAGSSYVILGVIVLLVAATAACLDRRPRSSAAEQAPVLTSSDGSAGRAAQPGPIPASPGHGSTALA